MEEKYLFVTGELLDNKNLKEILGTDVKKENFKIKNFESKTNINGRTYLIKTNKNTELNGKIITLNKEQIFKIDAWKQVPKLERKDIQINRKGKTIKLYYYTSEIEQIDKNENTNISNEISKFKEQISKNNLKYMDSYLMIPCDITNYNFTSNKESNNTIADFLIENIKINNMSEFKSDFVKCLEREVLGQYEIGFKSQDLKKEYNHEENCYIILTKHPKTQLGIITLYIPATLNSAQLLMLKFISNKLTIKIENEEKILTDWLNSIGIKIYGNAKALMFSQDKMKKKDIINLLACEYAPMGEIIGKEFEDMTKNNIAQYDGATVHISERCLLEISRVFEENIFSRIETQAIEIFFFELIMLQEAAISRICEKITKELEEENVKPYRKNNIEILDNLACEMSQSVLFLDFDCFIFPTVKISAKKNSKMFWYR